MQIARGALLAAPALAVALTLLAPSRAVSTPGAPDNVFQDGNAGFVVSDMAFALAPGGGGAAGCPNGLTSGYATIGDMFSPRSNAPADQIRPTLENSLQRVFSGGETNLCQNPELGAPDPNWRTVVGRRAPADGIDLDGQDSRADGRAAPGTCAHTDFVGLNGERGVDNQLFRVVGCTGAYQHEQRFNGSDAEMLAGAWGILIALSGVDDMRNDPDIEVALYANADPIQLSPSREALSNATYAAEPGPEFRARTHGRIVNGVISTDPVDFDHHWIANGMRLTRPLQGARLQLTFMPNGGVEDFLAGYTPVETLYNAMLGFRDGKDAAGNPSPARAYSSVGAALVHNLTCQGAYYALHQNADGDRDPATGRCRSISTQYRIEAVPAFIVEGETHGLNDDLER